MKRVLIVAFAALLPAFHLQAQDEAFGWMCQRNDPVSVAMAGVSLAPSSDISFSAFRNPAVIPYSESRFAVTAAYSPAVGDMTTDGLDVGVGMKTGERLGFSVAGNYNSCGEYEVIDDSGNRNGMFKTSSMMFSAGLGLKVIDALSVGINLKYAGERLASDSNQGQMCMLCTVGGCFASAPDLPMWALLSRMPPDRLIIYLRQCAWRLAMARLSRKNIPLRPEWTLIVFLPESSLFPEEFSTDSTAWCSRVSAIGRPVLM